jgi:sigma-B regulation protein RsbU (phosphoserine phosphatase)
MREELEMARELQLALLPQKFPSIPSNVPSADSAVRFLTYYFPTKNVSGDFFSVFPVTEKAIGIFICDVMGHGVRAALVTSMIRALIEENGREALEPGALLNRINRGLVAILEQAKTTMYATGFYLVIDIERQELSYATAAHPRPIVISHGGVTAEPLNIDRIAGPALGIFPDAAYGTARRPISSGDRIMLFTDGLFEVENSNGEMFDEQSLLSTVRDKMILPPREFFDEVLGEVRRFSSRETFEDDVCLVGVEVHNLNGNGR